MDLSSSPTAPDVPPAGRVPVEPVDPVIRVRTIAALDRCSASLRSTVELLEAFVADLRADGQAPSRLP